jgi:hypothetical protein
MPFMMTALAILLLVAASAFVIIEINHATAEGKLSPIDEPNFKPTITKITEDGRNLEIIEFKSKIKQ